MSDMITASRMLEAGKLETVAEWRERLAPGDEVEHVLLPTDGRTVFFLDETWFVQLDGKPGDEPLDAWVRIDPRVLGRDQETSDPDSRSYQVSKECLLDLCARVGLPRTYVAKTPARFLNPQLDYWYASPDKQVKLAIVDRVAQGVAKASLQPFSNARLLERAVEAIVTRYGCGADDVLVDTKSRHAMDSTVIYLVIPEATRSMRAGDDWSGGVEIKNSLTGEHPTTARSYLFRWWCTNGATTAGKSSGAYSRRGAQSQTESAYDWIGRAVEESLSSLEGEFDRVEAMTTEPIEGEVRVAIDNLAARNRLPSAVREAIRNEMMETPDVTMYGLMNAVTRAANRHGIPVAMRERLMDIGGDFVYGAGRCESCHSILVEGEEPHAGHDHS